MFNIAIKNTELLSLEMEKAAYSPISSCHSELFNADFDQAEQTGTIHGRKVKIWSSATLTFMHEDYKSSVTLAIIASLVLLVSICALPFFGVYGIIGIGIGIGRFFASCYVCKEIKRGFAEQEVVRVQQLWQEIRVGGLPVFEKKVGEVFASQALSSRYLSELYAITPPLENSVIEERLKQKFLLVLKENPSQIQQGLIAKRSLDRAISIDKINEDGAAYHHWKIIHGEAV